jgi:hypothetical protein
VTFDERFGPLASARPRIGRSHLLYCLDLYRQSLSQERDPNRVQDIVAAIESQVRKAALVPVVSDFLFADADALIRQLSHLNAVHDIFLLMADVRFAYEVPQVSDGWVEVFDIESGRTRVLSRREMSRLAASHRGMAGPRSSNWHETPISTSCAWVWIVGRWRRRWSNSQPSGGSGRCDEQDQGFNNHSRVGGRTHRRARPCGAGPLWKCRSSRKRPRRKRPVPAERRRPAGNAAAAQIGHTRGTGHCTAGRKARGSRVGSHPLLVEG